MTNLVKLLVMRFFPALAKMAYSHKRLREDRAYWGSIDLTSRAEGSSVCPGRKPRLLIVLPANFDTETPFKPALGNYNFEILRSAQERYGIEGVEVFFPSPATDWIQECRMIASQAQKEKISHLLFYIESVEPQSLLWRWDVLAAELVRKSPEVTAIGFLTDGTYELHQIQCNRFQEVFPRSIFVQIDVAPSSKYVSKGRLVGPTFLPISLESIKCLDENLAALESAPKYELSFIGKMYGYRMRVIVKLLKKGLRIAVNPHSSDDIERRASYVEYMQALRVSKYTINFSRANGTRQKQLKSRILESVLVGSIPMTDDDGLASKVLPLGTPILSFARPGEIPLAVHRPRVGGEESLHAIDNARLRTEEIEKFARSHFWRTLENGLSVARLPPLGPPSDAS